MSKDDVQWRTYEVRMKCDVFDVSETALRIAADDAGCHCVVFRVQETSPYAAKACVERAMRQVVADWQKKNDPRWSPV
jgi:hypothetical protein